MKVRPFHHWTDSKIRCHLCVLHNLALTYLRGLELRLARQGIKRTAKDTLDVKAKDMAQFWGICYNYSYNKSRMLYTDLAGNFP